jgi:hypothetical protein
MALLYADEDFSYPVVQRLRQLGHDLLTAHEAGQAGHRIPDAAVLAFATAAGRTVVTFNRRHFIRLHGEVSRMQASSSAPVTTMCWRWLTVFIKAHRL